MQRHAGRHMTQPPDITKIAASERPGVNRLARGLEALLAAAERQPDGLRQSRRSVVKALFPHEAERVTATLEGQRKPRRPSISKMIEEAERAGKPLASITMPDGTKLDFGTPESIEASNPWLAALPKATKQ
jgi:hypothetical protein